MRSMYRFSIIALAVASLALIVAGTAFAEGKFDGSVTAGFGQSTFTPGAPTGESSSQLFTQSEAIVNFSGTSGPVFVKYRLEYMAAKNPAQVIDFGEETTVTTGSNAGNNGSFNNARNAVGWKATDALTLTIAGASFGHTAGLAPYGATTVGHLGSLGGPGDGHVTQWVFGVNDADMEIDFNLGTMSVGLVIAGDYDLKVKTVGATIYRDPLDPTQGIDTKFKGGPTSDLMTTVPYFNGKFGDIAVHAYMANSTGTAKKGSLVTGQDKDPLSPKLGEAIDSTKDVGFSSTEISVAGIYTMAGMKFALQYVTGSYENDLSTKDNGEEVTGLNVGGTVGPITFHMLNYKEERLNPSPTVKDPDTDTTDIGVGYTAAIAEGASWAVQYGSKKSNLKNGNTNSQILFSLQGKY